MPLLLAIEPDARQAACLTALVSTHLSAQLVVTSTIEEGLQTLQQCRPDLVLASASLSAADQAALTATLAATHLHRHGVPTLTIPNFASLRPSRRTKRLLDRLLRPGWQPGTSGEDPAAFAARISESLALSAAVRRACTLSEIDTTPPASPHMPAPLPATRIDLQVLVEPEQADEPVVDVPWLDLEPYLEGESTAPVAPCPAVADDPPQPDVIELPPPDELWAQLTPGGAERMAPLEGTPMTPRTSRADSPATGDGSGAVAEEGMLPRAARSPAEVARPTQDEWGLYDPEQCGFAALRLRLDELANDERRERERGKRSAIMRR